MKIFFWNIKKEIPEKILNDLSDHIDPDIIIFCENKMKPTLILENLNHIDNKYHFLTDLTIKENDIAFFSKWKQHEVIPGSSYSKKIISKKIKVNGYPSINLIAVHLPSKLFSKPRDYDFLVVDLLQTIKNIEENTKHKNTMIVGDFNIDPYSESMNSVNLFNSVMSISTAKRKTRKYKEKDFDYYYNPMWSFFGENGKGSVHGTYQHKPSEVLSFEWHILDQFLIKSNLADLVDEKELDIITEIGGTNLLTKQKNIDDSISDHLPIIIKINKNE